MPGKIETARHGLIVGAMVLLTIQPGCKQCGTDKCADIPQGAIPPPAGTYACRWQNAQAFRAEQDDFTIHQCEWLAGGSQLGPDGRKHAAEIARRWDQLPFPVVITPADDPNLNGARKDTLVNLLASDGVVDPAERVIVAYPKAEGLYGQEAARYGNMRLQGGSMMGGGMGGGMMGGMGGGMMGGGMMGGMGGGY
jgi:hypothetical protein